MTKKFKENLKTAVFSSKYVMKLDSPIVYVAHHADGTWEFWGKEVIDESEVVVVSLENIIKIDPTVLEIADLPVEFNAVRDSKTSPWRLVSKN
jgi:hypothetical protein